MTDLIADLAIPGVSAPELTLIKPDIDASGPESVADPPRRAHILRGVTQEHRSRRCARRFWRLFPHPRPLGLVWARGACPDAAWQAISICIALPRRADPRYSWPRG